MFNPESIPPRVPNPYEIPPRYRPDVGTLSMVVGRDYSPGSLAGWYECVIYAGDVIVARHGGIMGTARAKAWGRHAARIIMGDA